MGAITEEIDENAYYPRRRVNNEDPMISPARSRPLAERHHAMVVGRGLYLLRYVSASSDENPPVVAVNQHPRNSSIAVMSAPGGSDSHLQAPGDCMVVRANGPGSISLVVFADGPDASIDAELRLERILAATDDAATQRSVSAKIVDINSPSSGSSEISVMAHVSRRGDVVAEPGQWICGPELPLPIEGIEIDWPNKPSGVDLRYQVATSRSAGRHALSAAIGQFAGSRGKAAPLVSIELALSGPRAVQYELQCDALFLGAAILSQSGRQLSLSGPSGREPLVGLRLQIADAQKTPAQKFEETKPQKKRPCRKVRVYRPAAAVGREAITSDNNHYFK